MNPMSSTINPKHYKSSVIFCSVYIFTYIEKLILIVRDIKKNQQSVFKPPYKKLLIPLLVQSCISRVYLYTALHSIETLCNSPAKCGHTCLWPLVTSPAHYLHCSSGPLVSNQWHALEASVDQLSSGTTDLFVLYYYPARIQFSKVSRTTQLQHVLPLVEQGLFIVLNSIFLLLTFLLRGFTQFLFYIYLMVKIVRSHLNHNIIYRLLKKGLAWFCTINLLGRDPFLGISTFST